PTPIIVWCHPRSVSSAFERGFMQRPDTRVWHEPLGDPFYFSKDRPCKRYSDDHCKSLEHWETSVESVTKSLLEPTSSESKESCRYIFIKDMAQYIFPARTLGKLHPGSTVYESAGEGGQADQDGQEAIDELENPTVLPTALLKRFKHTFLIRTPEKSVPSYWKCVQEKAAGFEYFDGAEAGYAELKLLYQWISNPESTFNKPFSGSKEGGDQDYPGEVQDQPQPPPLVDASVLLSHPHHTISSYCKAVGIPFYPGMLEWESGPVEEWKKWGTYHKGAENSTGFRKEVPSSSSTTKIEGVSVGAKAEGVERPLLPEPVRETIEKNMDDYRYLLQRVTIKAP
ncbi:hypothetical protein IE53DRAFT_294926, partial [Violaceomyces palustris]